MSGFHFTPEAIEDLWAIWHFIAVKNQNPQAAEQLWMDIEEAGAKLAHLPFLGHRRKDITANPHALFYLVRDHYLVVYQKDTDPLQIVRVFHGAQDIAAELRWK